MDEYIAFEKIITALIVAIPTSYLSVRLALRRYRTEKWWDKKLMSYLDTLTDLNNLILYCDVILDIKYENIDYTSKQLNVLKSRFYKSRLHLQAQVNIGKILYSKKINTALLNFNNQLFSINNCEDAQAAAKIRELAEECVSIIEEHSKNDLGIK